MEMKKYTQIFTLFFCFMFFISFQAQAEWVENVVYSLNRAEIIRCADIDRDGHVDCALTQWRDLSGGSLSILWGDGAGNFKPQIIEDSANTSWAREVKISNARPFRNDLILIAHKGGIHYYKQSMVNPRTFTRSTIQGPTAGLFFASGTQGFSNQIKGEPFYVSVQECFGTSTCETEGTSVHTINWYLGLSDNFTLLTTRNSLKPAYVIQHDVDGNGSQDTIVARYWGVDWYSVSDKGIVGQRRSLVEIPKRDIDFIKAEDINGDGVKDFLITGPIWGVGWIDGTDQGLFDNSSVTPNMIFPVSEADLYYADTTDLDLDGDMDVVSVSLSPDYKVRIHKQTGGSWSSETIGTAGGRAVSIAQIIPGGRPEIMVSDWEGGQIRMYEWK